MRRESPIRRTNPSGRVVFVARYTDANGKRKSAGTFKLKRDAQDAIDAAYAGPQARPTSITVGDYFKTWLMKHPRYERTALTYDSHVRSVLDAPVDGVPLRDFEFAALRRSHALQVLDYMLRVQGRAQKGAATVFAVLSAMAEDAIGEDVLPYNVFRGVRLRANDPRIQKKPRTVTVLSWEEMWQIAAAAGEYEPMLRVLSDCGLRLGEMLALGRADLADGRLLVHNVAWRGKRFSGTKTTHGLPENEQGRIVPVPPATGALLQAMPKRIDSLLLFPDARGNVWKDVTWRRVVWYPAVERAGIRATPHDFRHSWVSNLRALRIDPAELARAAGHTVQTATAHYVHPTGLWFDEIRKTVGRSVSSE